MIRSPSQLNDFLCGFVEWVIFENGNDRLFLNDITTTRCRNVEKHFTEYWTQYGGTLQYKKDEIIMPPPHQWSHHFIDHFVAVFIQEQYQLQHYGYKDY